MLKRCGQCLLCLMCIIEGKTLKRAYCLQRIAQNVSKCKCIHYAEPIKMHALCIAIRILKWRKVDLHEAQQQKYALTRSETFVDGVVVVVLTVVVFAAVEVAKQQQIRKRSSWLWNIKLLLNLCLFALVSAFGLMILILKRTVHVISITAM